MAYSRTYETIILKAYDVGEADRFLILFTRERGRLTARARGVRKPGSRMGGHVLPFQLSSITLVEGHAGLLVVAAQRTSPPVRSEIVQFLHAEEGIEILTTLLHDEEPLPEIFDCTQRFLGMCQEESSDPVLPFTIAILHRSGLLPDMRDAEHAPQLSPQSRAAVHACTCGEWKAIADLPQDCVRTLKTLCNDIVAQSTGMTLRTPGIAAALMDK